MRQPTKEEWQKQLSVMGHTKRWAKRRKVIDNLKEFGGTQPNYSKWATWQLQFLLKVWQKIKN